MLVEVFDHVSFDQLTIEHGLAHDTTDETEVDEMVIRARDFCKVFEGEEWERCIKRGVLALTTKNTPNHYNKF